jgi:hypothetical protein
MRACRLLLVVACLVLAAAAVLPLVAAGQAKGAQASRVAPPVEITPAMRKQAQDAQAQNAGRTVFRLSPDGRALRDRSRRRYGNLSRSEAIGLAHAEFGDVFGGPIWRLPRLPSGFAVDEFVNDNQFYVKTGHGRERQLLMSTLPSSAVNDQGDRELVSTDLARAGDQLVPENSAAPVAIAEQASGGIGFEGTGVHVDLVGATASTATVEADKAIFPDALTDADYTVAALPTGAETFLQLRTADAPEEARFRFAVPPGGELQLTGNPIGAANAQVGARVVKDGQTVLKIAPPNARDADDRPVPVHYAIDGNDLILKVDHRGGDFLYPILVDPQYVIDRMGSTGNPVFGFWRSMNGFDPYDCTWNPYCDTGTGLGGPGLYINARPQGYPTDWSGYAQWYYQAPRGSSIMRVDWNGWGHTGTASCIYGRITGQYGDLQAGQLNQCETVYGNGYTPIFATNPTAGNWARFLQFQYNGTFVGDWTKVRDPMISLWEGMSPYFQSLRPLDPAQWNESARSTRWLGAGEVFRYQYNVHDDGLGLDTVDENNFGRMNPDGTAQTRQVATGACDFPVQSCAYDYVMPENSTTWAANDTSTFPEGITSNWARAFDNVGNQGCCYNWTIKVDRTAPTLDTVGGSLAGLDGQSSAGGSYDLFVTANDGNTSSASAQRSGVKSMNIQFIDPSGVARFSHPQLPGCSAGNCSLSDWVPFDTNNYAVPYGFGTWTIRITAHDALDHGVQRDLHVTVNKPADYDACMQDLDEQTGRPDATYCAKHDRDAGAVEPSDMSEPTDAGDAPTCSDCEPVVTDPDNQMDAPADPSNALFKPTVKDPIYGISEGQSVNNTDGVVESMDSPWFAALKIKKWRRILPYNLVDLPATNGSTPGSATRDGWNEMYADAKQKKIQLMVSFQAAEDGSGGLMTNHLPSKAEYKSKVLAFAKQYPYVNVMSAWNEPNYRAQPTRNGRSGAKWAAIYTSILQRYVCKASNGCRTVAADLTDNVGWQDYLRLYATYLASEDRDRGVSMPTVWGFHPYQDIDNELTSGTDEFFSIVQSKAPASSVVWLSEIGARLDVTGFGPPLAQDVNEQGDEVHFLLHRIVKRKLNSAGHVLHPAVDRVYYYHFWTPQDSPAIRWDSGLMDRGGSAPQTTRPAYGELHAVTNP